MTAVWVVRDRHGSMVDVSTSKERVYSWTRDQPSHTITRETLLTPEHAAVIEAAGVMADFIGRPPTTNSYHEWMVARDGLLTAVATLRELEAVTRGKKIWE